MIIGGLMPHERRFDVVRSWWFSPTQSHRWFAKRYPETTQYFTDSGRSALLGALLALQLPPASTIALPAYTCVVVVNAVIAAGYRPYFIDVTQAGLMDPAAFLPCLKDVDAVLLQHTFGQLTTAASIANMARGAGLPIIEDAAHILTPDGEEGRFGDMVVHSFGPEKPVSAIRGGVLIVRNSKYDKTVKDWYTALPETPVKTQLRLFFTGLMFAWWRPLYHVFVGKAVLALWRTSPFSQPIIEPAELRGRISNWMPAKLANQHRRLLALRLTRLHRDTQHRIQLTAIYQSYLSRQALLTDPLIPALEYPYRSPVEAPQCINWLKRLGIQLSVAWSGAMIVPAAAKPILTKQETAQLEACTQAAAIAKQIILLPAHTQISPEQAKRLAITLNTLCT